MTKAADKRYAGIKRVNDAVVSIEITDEGPKNVWHTHDAGKIAAEIRSLADLGRTGRWKDAVEGWALLVEEKGSEGDPKGIEWAFFQGGIFAGYAAE